MRVGKKKKVNKGTVWVERPLEDEEDDNVAVIMKGIFLVQSKLPPACPFFPLECWDFRQAAHTQQKPWL